MPGAASFFCARLVAVSDHCCSRIAVRSAGSAGRFAGGSWLPISPIAVLIAAAGTAGPTGDSSSPTRRMFRDDGPVRRAGSAGRFAGGSWLPISPIAVSIAVAGTAGPTSLADPLRKAGSVFRARLFSLPTRDSSSSTHRKDSQRRTSVLSGPRSFVALGTTGSGRAPISAIDIFLHILSNAHHTLFLLRGCGLTSSPGRRRAHR